MCGWFLCLPGKEVNMTTVPIQIDSIKRHEEFQRTRFIYFRIEIEDWFDLGPHPELISMGLDNLFGGWAALSGPLGHDSSDELFINSDLINQAFQTIEGSRNLNLELGYIWLPNDFIFLEEKYENIRKGDIYRIPLQGFYECYKLVAGIITDTEWLKSISEFSRDILPSPEETKAFRSWRVNQISRSRERYHAADYAVRRLPQKELKQ
jgi:hypothetical protein